MRRNSAGRRGGGHNVSGGPLITEHLKDIDLELELLKRKREMIEQHQLYSMSNFESQTQYANYEPPRSYNQQHFGSDRDFSHMYNEGTSFAGQHDRKRRADPWDPDVPKMFPNKKKPIQSIFGSRLGPKPGPSGSGNGPAPARYQRPHPTSGHNPKPFHKSPAPLMTIMTPGVGQKFNKKPVVKMPSSLNKVSKLKPATPPNNLASKPVAEVANLVAEACRSSAIVDESLVLRKDCPPTPQMTGRLELTLGAILKEIRDQYGNTPPYITLFNNAHMQRVMKQVIRERIKVAMTGKVVGSSHDIKKHYRAEYPGETDLDILNIALGAAGLPPDAKHVNTPVEPEERQDDSFKLNMYNLMDQRITEMFTKLKELYAKESPQTVDEKLDQTDTSLTDTSLNDITLSDDEAGGERTRYKASRAMVKKFLPRLLKKHTYIITSIINMDEIYLLVKASIAAKASQVAKDGSGDAPVKADDNHDEAMPAKKTSITALPYYVKIRAKPSLPKKKIMRDFLDSFNTKIIKKHKGIHNLLFVGFSEKKDYDNMLAANGTVIGRIVLEISPSEKAAPKPSQEEDKDSLNTSIDNIISPELDGQITDLLTSIRKADEEDKVIDDDNSQENGVIITANEDKQQKDGETDGNTSTIEELQKHIQVLRELAQETDAKEQAEADREAENNTVTDNAVEPTESAQNPESLVKTPEEVLEMKDVADVPEKVAETTAKVAATATPAKVAATATPAKVAAIATPAKVAVIATPAKVAATATPAKAAAIPAKVAATPTKVAETPAKVATAPAFAATATPVAATSAKVAATATPAKVAVTSAKVAATSTPAKVAAAPAVPATATPVKVTAPPAKVTATATTAKDAVTVTSAKVAATPTPKVAAAPAVAATATPVKATATPAKVTATATTPKVAAIATTAKVAATATPAKVVANATNAKVAATPAKVVASATSAKVATNATPAKVAETPARVAETPAKVAEVTAKVAEPLKSDAKIIETPENVEIDSEKSDTVTELKNDAKETGRSTPTRMTRSANVTPSTIRTRRASRLAQNQ